MLLTLDIGNTEITMGLFRGAELQAHWRLTTNPGRTPDEWGSAIGGFLLGAGHSPNEVRAVCLASVAPSVTQAVIAGISRTTGCTGVQIDARSPLPIQLDVDEPLSVGADRIVNALAANHLYGGPCIVVDFGTATTFDAVNARGDYVGGAIAPGIEISVEALGRRGAQLHRVELARPRSVIGRSTVEALQSGILYGFAGQVDGMVRRLSAALAPDDPASVQVIATGGLASLVIDHSETVTRYEPDLTLIGLRLIYERNT